VGPLEILEEVFGGILRGRTLRSGTLRNSTVGLLEFDFLYDFAFLWCYGLCDQPHLPISLGGLRFSLRLGFSTSLPSALLRVLLDRFPLSFQILRVLAVILPLYGLLLLWRQPLANFSLIRFLAESHFVLGE